MNNNQSGDNLSDHSPTPENGHSPGQNPNKTEDLGGSSPVGEGSAGVIHNPELMGEKEGGKRGGARPGAGRPIGSLKEENRTRLELKRQWLEMVKENATAIFQTQLQEALGIYVEKTAKDGKVRIYRTKPNPMSLAWMLEHVWGRAPQKMILEGSVDTKNAMTPEMQALIDKAMAYALPNSAFDESPRTQDADCVEVRESKDKTA